ncbi:hypothetical protein BVC80_1287g5 [Macleaya cordata]|uniref:Kelch repeat type 1 n=1 Tax=Macleaya cordata TaxID=56857 RepID=A0A200Q7X0_MACCD|nr:hypothetical protein BVC80_1287g5 [Macleaya cordata]
MDPNNWLVVGERIEDLETMIISTWNDSEFQRSWWKIERNVEKKITVIKKLHDSHNDKLKGISTVWVNSHLYCTGGKNALGICSNQAMSYNFLEEDWNKAHDIDIPRSDHVSLSLKISESYVFGGNQEKFASRFSTTKHGGEEIGFSINNPQSFGDEVESFALHFIKKKQHDAVAYFWMPRGEGFNVVQYTFASRRWDLIP